MGGSLSLSSGGPLSGYEVVRESKMDEDHSEDWPIAGKEFFAHLLAQERTPGLPVSTRENTDCASNGSSGHVQTMASNQMLLAWPPNFSVSSFTTPGANPSVRHAT